MLAQIKSIHLGQTLEKALYRVFSKLLPIEKCCSPLKNVAIIIPFFIIFCQGNRQTYLALKAVAIIIDKQNTV